MCNPSAWFRKTSAFAEPPLEGAMADNRLTARGCRWKAEVRNADRDNRRALRFHGGPIWSLVSEHGW